jgi:Na+/melibiose symporter-like transporter
MGIKLRHVRFAFMRTAGILVVFLVVLVALAAFGERTVEDMLWGSGAAIIMWTGFFAYWLWCTQKKKSHHPPPGEWS